MEVSESGIQRLGGGRPAGDAGPARGGRGARTPLREGGRLVEVMAGAMEMK